MGTMIHIDRLTAFLCMLAVTENILTYIFGSICRLYNNNILSISCFSELKLFKFIWLSIEISNRDFKIPCSDLLV